MLFASRKPLQARTYKRDALMLAGAGVALGADWPFLFEAYNYAGVGVSTILCYCALIIVMALSPLLFGEIFTPTKIAGFVVVVAGAAFVNASAVVRSSNSCSLVSEYGVINFFVLV